MSRIVVVFYRLAYWLYLRGVPCIPSLICKLFIRIPFSCQIGLGAKFGRNVSLGYGGLGVVIHARSVIEDGVSIGTGVTIGGTNKRYGVPVIGANSMIATGAKILGPVTVGKNCVVGANAVLLESIPDNCVAVGIPARIVKRNIDISCYKD